MKSGLGGAEVSTEPEPRDGYKIMFVQNQVAAKMIRETIDVQTGAESDGDLAAFQSAI